MKISEIKTLLPTINDINDWRIQDLMQDKRISVQKLVTRHQQRLIKEQQVFQAFQQSLHYERVARQQGYRVIVGIDEVGRGPLAGPVVASAVVLPEECYIAGLTDSKKLTANKRQQLFGLIVQQALAIGIGIVEHNVIDKINILEATKLAMYQAIEQVEQQINIDYLLIDALNLSNINLPQLALIKGDVKSASIAAASIIAKETRDNLMKTYAEKYPYYGFEKNAGYGTAQHLAAIKQYGICEIHRCSFEPIKSIVTMTSYKLTNER